MNVIEFRCGARAGERSSGTRGRIDLACLRVDHQNVVQQTTERAIGTSDRGVGIMRTLQATFEATVSYM